MLLQMLRFTITIILLLISSNVHPSEKVEAISCKAGAYTSWQPHLYWENNTLNGPLYDYLVEQLSKVNLKIDLQPQKPRNRMLRDLKSGDIDIILSSVYSKEREESFVLSPHVHIARLGLVGSKEMAAMPLTDIKAATIDFLSTDEHVLSLTEQGVEFIFVQSVKRSVDLLNRGVVDAIYVNQDSLVSNPSIADLTSISVDSLTYHTDSIKKKYLHMMFNKTSKCAKKINELTDNILEMRYQTSHSVAK